jgi:hypothetical protein
MMSSIPSVNIASSTAPNWLQEAQESLLAAANAGGMMGALQNAKNPGSLKAFLRRSLDNAMGFALISQSAGESAASLAAQAGAKALQKRIAERMAEAQAHSRPPKNFTPAKGLDPVIHFHNGSSLDTVTGIMTMSDGKQIDIKTGKEYVDEAALIRMANGAYLDTKNNILHLPDGTKIDTVTRLLVTT